MGFYIRKSVSVGPLRFNLSQSGIGISAGFKGFRVGTGPRGNYVHMGLGGIYFRQTLPNIRDGKASTTDSTERQSNIQFHETEAGNVAGMVDSSSAALLEEINTKSRKILIWPWVLALAFLSLAGLLAENSPVWKYCVLGPVFAFGVFATAYADKQRKTVILAYHLERHIEQAYQNLHDAFGSLKSCNRIWHISSRGKITTTYDWKVNAGASALIKRRGINLYLGSPPHLQSNLLIPVLPGERQRLYFFPDRILVWNSSGNVGALEFNQLELHFIARGCIEESGVPSDSQVVGKTWRYVNKNGSPDRRFNYNREIPIALYEEVLLLGPSELQELFQLSRIGLATRFEQALKQMASAISQTANRGQEAFLKCPCNHCQVLLEFPKHGVGETVKCPHCGLHTTLFNPSRLTLD